MDPGELSVENVSALRILEPFGAANEVPVFAFRKVMLDGIYPIGSGRHLRLRFKKAGMVFYMVYFGMTEVDFPYQVGEIVDVAATCEVSDFNGEERTTVKIRDIRPSSLSQERLFQGNLIYDGFRRGEPIPEGESPERNDLADVYRYLKKNGSFHGELDVLFGRITGENKDCTMDSCKMRFCLDVLEEMNLITRNFDGRMESIELRPTAEKVDLERSALLAKLRKGFV